jgi:hypothetical protein
MPDKLDEKTIPLRIEDAFPLENDSFVNLTFFQLHSLGHQRKMGINGHFGSTTKNQQKIIFYAAALFFCLSPGLFYFGITKSYIFQHWGMYAHTRPLCTLRFLSMTSALNEKDFHERVISVIGSNRQFRYALPFLLNDEAEARQFLNEHCNIQGTVGPVTYNLSCFAEGRWLELEKGRSLTCL